MDVPRYLRVRLGEPLQLGKRSLDGSGNGDYQMGGYTTQANFQTATTAPNLWVITPNSGTYNRGGYVVMQARGRWK